MYVFTAKSDVLTLIEHLRCSFSKQFCFLIYLHNCHHIYKIYFQGIFYAIVISGLRVLRVCYGSLPIFLCNIAGFLNASALLFAALTVTMSTFTKFMFVYIWKRMRQMDDNLIVRIATIQATVMTLLFEAASWSGSPFQGQPPVSLLFLLLLTKF